MKWLPFEVFEFEFRGTPDEFRSLLACQVGPPKLLQLSHGGQPFTGIVDVDGFRLRLSTGQRDSLAPVLHGRCRANESGTTISVEMIPTKTVLFVVVIFMACVMQLIFRKGPLIPFLYAALMASSWLLCMTCFWLDGGRSKRSLLAVFSGASSSEHLVDGSNCIKQC